MKKIFLYIIAALLVFCAFGCDDTSGGTTTSTASKSTSHESIESEDTNSEALLLAYPFLDSDYVVTSFRDSSEISYICNYYFVDGFIEGAKLITILPDEETAKAYHEETLEDYPDAELSNTKVIHYLYDDDHYYYGYTLEKLEFVLTTAQYEYTVNFDKDLFNMLFYDTSED